MLKKIIRLQNVGLFENGSPGPVSFGHLTLVYGENGRGKSTLASVLRSCASGDATKLLMKRTLDSAAEMQVSLLFDFEGESKSISLHKGSWNGQVPNIVVFDSEFVEQNVYSGQEVRADQRQALLEFALGDQSVVLKQKIDDLVRQIDSVTRERSESEKTLTTAFSRKIPLNQFIALPAIPDAEQQKSSLRKRIEATNNMNALLQRQDPEKLHLLEFDTTVYFDMMGKTLEDVQEAAETAVQEHFMKHKTPRGIEDWVSRGQGYVTGEECPFCGLPLKNSSLIRAYRGYFNQAYVELKKQLSSLLNDVNVRLSEDRVDELARSMKTNTARIDAWKDLLTVEAPFLELNSLRAAILNAHQLAVELVKEKQRQPLEKIDTKLSQVIITGAISKINAAVQDYNQHLTEVTSRITEFKNGLSSESISDLQKRVGDLELAVIRHSSDVVNLIKRYEAVRAERKKLDTEKSETRKQLDNLMKDTLTQYQSKINQTLKKFGASFTVEELKPNYKGNGEPRTEYMIQLRQKSVRLGDRNETGPHFGSVLSEADKRTLAFAFFLSRIEADSANMANQIVVLDDPVSSLDRNRREQTLAIIESLVPRCAQVIVLSHEEYFVRELRERVERRKLTQEPPHTMCITRVQQDYSAFTECDIDAICASDYYRDYTRVSDYVNGTFKGDIRDVAKSLRPLLEGYYHHRYLRILPKRAMFGKIIEEIKKAESPSPLVHLQGSVEKIEEVNAYVSRFHHDDNQAINVGNVTDSELKNYAELTLGLIYKG